jgi:hypothetical protein
VELAFWLHADGDPQRAAEAHRFGAPGWLFPAEGEPDAPLRDGARLLSLDDPAVLVSAIEPRLANEARSEPKASEGGGAGYAGAVPARLESTPLIRLYNASAAPRSVRVRWGGPGARGLSPVDLAGNATRLDGFAPGEGASATLALRPWQIASLTTI